MESLLSDLRNGMIPPSIEHLEGRLQQLTVGLTQRIPVIGRNARMFRVRRLEKKPEFINEVGAPPANVAPLGRLNEQGRSVLYLADSPDTAFAESRVNSGEFCLSEWRTDVERLGMSNGGISPEMIAERFEHNKSDNVSLPKPTSSDELILDFFREIYTFDVSNDVNLYRWSIACALVNGFAHRCDRQTAEKVGGNTVWRGKYPFSAIAYPSVRTQRPSLNFALNDLGMSYVKLKHVQWVRRSEDGSYTSLDFADTWDSFGMIQWQNRPARFRLRNGEGARLTKIAENIWTYETLDGSIPWFS